MQTKMMNVAGLSTLAFLLLVAYSALPTESYVANTAPPLPPQDKDCPLGKRYPDPRSRCGGCKCDKGNVSCLTCALSLFSGYVKFMDETKDYPACCPTWLNPDKVTIRKVKEGKSCSYGEEKMCVKIN